MKLSIMILYTCMVLIFISCGETEGISLSSKDCYLPEGTSLSLNQRYIKGKVNLPLGNGTTTAINLFVQRVEKVDSSTWGSETLDVFSNTGKDPCETYVEMKNLWIEFYQDMIDAGLHSDVILDYAGGISNLDGDTNREGSGIYGETHLSSCGYNGAYGTITCLAAATVGVKEYYMAHENTHGFQWNTTLNDVNNQSILFFRIFSAYANTLYHQDIADSSVFTDSSGRWGISLEDYALQNEAEWIAEIFRDYLYAGTGQWAYIDNNETNIASFFDCVWKEGKTFTACQTQTSVSMVSYAQKIPVVDIPTHAGLTAAESEAVWNICFDTNNKAAHLATFNSLIETLTPGLFPDAADNYELGYGDCDHDGVLDWVCTYEGPGADGGNYFWNTNNQVGAYTFIASGKTGNGYAEHKQDPYLVDKGTLVQPVYREWTGNNGSCNGSMSFKKVPTRFSGYASGVVGLPAEFVGKVDW